MNQAQRKELADLRLFIGNQTSFAAANFLEPFQYALANGFEAFEWFPDRKPSGVGWDETDLSATLLAEVKEQARSAGLRISVHARWTANLLEPEGHASLRRDLDLAVSLGARLLNLHLYTEAGTAAFLAALLPLLRLAAAKGVAITLENTVETPPQAFNQFFEQLADRKSPGFDQLGMCLDIGHANLCAATRNDYLGFLDQLGSHVPILHLHLHENWGEADTHLPLFTGPAATHPAGIIGLLERLAARHYNGSAILEQWPNPPSLLNDARDRLRELLQFHT